MSARAAAIDIGTNSTRLLVADVSGGRVEVKKTGLKTTRLGQGAEGCLSPAAMERTVEAVAEFVEEARRLRAGRIVAAATSAVRDAANQKDFQMLVKKRTGLEVKVLSGEAEAALSYRGAMAGLNLDPLTTAVLDVGGGSTELVWREGGRLRLRSVNAGAVRMTAAGAGREEIAAVLEPLLEEARGSGLRRLVAVGGSATTCAAVDLRLFRYDPEQTHGHVLFAGRIWQIRGRLMRMPLEERKKIPGLQPERADIIVAGLTILGLVVDGLGLDRVHVSEADILQGLLLEEVENQ